ncbi:MAG: hypothetical protein KDC18_02625 [Alphaproteobacteria bacterium]|nr:hypothetical protein [Alphaproteobacteria bacterium]MCB9929029.1 hypothetical protein [Alphaproteobacteria bacterium]
MNTDNQVDFPEAEIIFNQKDQQDIYRAAAITLKERTIETPMSVKDLEQSVQEIVSDSTKNSLIYLTILDASKHEKSRLRSKKGRGGGYYLIPQEVAEAEEKDRILPTKSEYEKEKVQEKHIWPLVSMWFRVQKEILNASHEIANLKSGGTWSNPDVVAILPVDELGFFDVEISTAEVKPSLLQWRYYFFEAVSHKRFSERSYFIFRSAPGDPDQTPDLLQYAEKYGVGVVVIELSDDDFSRLPNWNKISESDKKQLLEYIVEKVPAPYTPISTRDKIEFLRRIGIQSKGDLYKFGLSK